MPNKIFPHEQAIKDLEKTLSAPKEIVVNQSTARRLDELCCEMTDTCGHIEAILQLAVENESEMRAYIRTALNLSARGRKSIKMFLSEWSVLVEESKRENPGRSPTDSPTDDQHLPLPSNPVTTHYPTPPTQPAPFTR